MPTDLKRKIAFALAMGIITTGSISFTILSINLGFSAKFVAIWLRSWAVAYLVVVPIILLVGPRLQRRIDSLIS